MLLSEEEDLCYNVNDEYNIREDWELFKKNCNEFELQLTKFLSHTKNKEAGIRARKKLKELKIQTKFLAKKILKKKQDYDSDYS